MKSNDNLKFTAAFILSVLSFVTLLTAPIQVVAAAADDNAENASKTLALVLRKRVETQEGSGRFHTVIERARWDAEKTAVVVCDMWDRHWCRGATGRVAELAPRIDEFVDAARALGAVIVHAPRGTPDAYAGSPQPERTRGAPWAATEIPPARPSAMGGGGRASSPARMARSVSFMISAARSGLPLASFTATMLSCSASRTKVAGSIQIPVREGML